MFLYYLTKTIKYVFLPRERKDCCSVRNKEHAMSSVRHEYVDLVVTSKYLRLDSEPGSPMVSGGRVEVCQLAQSLLTEPALQENGIIRDITTGVFNRPVSGREFDVQGLKFSLLLRWEDSPPSQAQIKAKAIDYYNKTIEPVLEESKLKKPTLWSVQATKSV